ncbi:SpoIIE family protein phosphatase [Thermopolyspora sp. NPDC052614]|uniref:SpoIIE family protein phosphatase n=1 Tax=Thermopolyspora sp. NPDC052614 TaxID=3155682 RepID=UPI0034323247
MARPSEDTPARHPRTWYSYDGAETTAARLFRRAMARARTGCWEWNIRANMLACDGRSLEILGVDPARFDPRPEGWAAVAHPDDLPWVLAEMGRAVHERGLFGVEYRVRRPAGGEIWVRVSGHVVLGDNGEPVSVVGAIHEMRTVQAAHESIRSVLRYMGDGFIAIDHDWKITFANAKAEHLLGADRNPLGSRLWDLVPTGLHDLEARLRTAVAEGMTADIEVRWPSDRRWYRLVAAPAPSGLTIHLTDINDRRRREAERSAAERAAAERTARLADLTIALSEALTMQDVVETAARHLLPPFGAGGLQIWEVDDGEGRLIGSVGYPAEFSAYMAREYTGAGVQNLLEPITRREPTFVESAEEFIAEYPELAYIPQISRKEAWAFLPLIASGHPLGAAIIAFDEPHAFPREERDLLLTLAGLVAQALERARLYDDAHRRAQELQQDLLPRDLPELPGVTVAARYVPAEKEMEVGGDWYDVIALSAERVALVVGDVVGHGVAEAAAMGRLRTAVRTLADLELPPDEILGHLNDIVSEISDDFYATCLYIVYDPIDRSCVLSLAGHPPPAVVLPGGTVCFPSVDPGPPLGAADPPFATVSTHLPEHSLLVLYTDGLIECADRDFEEGMAGLAHMLTERVVQMRADRPPGGDADGDGTASSAGIDCDALAEDLLLLKRDSTDDAALLIACTHVTRPEDIAVWRLPEDAIAAALARDHVRGKLAEWRLDSLIMTTELLVSELVGNVVRHAKGPIDLRMIRGNVLTCEVSDASLTTPRIRRASDYDEGGRGLQLVAALSHRWGTRYTSTGKSIWVEQTFPPADALDSLDQTF